MARRDHPLKRLSDQQKHGKLDTLLGVTEMQISAAYADARESVAHALREFARAYAAEQRRLAAEHDDDDRDVDGFRVSQPVPLTWLHSSGWDARIKHAMGQASHTASSVSRRAAARGVRAVGDLGKENAHEMLRLAMKPAMRKVPDWRPR